MVPQVNHDKVKAWEKYNFNVMIVGDDWKNTKEWNEHEKQFSEINVEIAYLPRTKNISSSSLRNIVKK